LKFRLLHDGLAQFTGLLIDDRIGVFSPTVTNPLAGNRLGALTFWGDGTGRNGRRHLLDSYKKAFGPRLGLAYSFDPKTVIRASYGISYNNLSADYIGLTTPLAYGWTAQASRTVAVGSDDADREIKHAIEKTHGRRGPDVEGFVRFVDRGTTPAFAEEASRTLPFTTSVLDGIDVRETIRHWTEKKIYVRESGRTPGEIGVVVVIFDEDQDKDGERYPYQLTWLGEHGQESDMAFYATPPERAIVGPGVCRVTYGGFLLSYPPGRLGDVWGDPDYREAESKPEVLLLAALDYSRERIVVHAAPQPPRAIFHQIAARLDRKILHLPIGTLSPATIKKIRVMHVLSGHAKREIAKDYVW